MTMNMVLRRKIERLKKDHDYEVDASADLKQFLKVGLNNMKKFISLVEKL